MTLTCIKNEKVKLLISLIEKNSENQMHLFYLKTIAFCWLEKYNYLIKVQM